MEEMLDFFESTGQKLDSLDLSSITNYMENNFVSTISFNGTPILPPVMTKKRREEMLAYKRQASVAETRLKSSRRERQTKRPLTIVQSVQNADSEGESVKDLTHTSQARENHSNTDMGVFLGTVDIAVEDGGVSDAELTQTLNSVEDGTGSQLSKDMLQNVMLTETASGSLQLESGQPSLEGLGIPSFLESMDLPSLDDGGSLPTEYNGVPLTTTRQQQISQVLAKLSRDLNIKESLTSTSSSANSQDVTLGASTELPSLPLSLTNSQTAMSCTTSDQDSKQGSIHEMQIREEMAEASVNESSSTIKSVGNASNDELCVDNTSTDSVRSPKSPKNTVHFASTVTEIYTDKSSGESSTLQKSLQSPAATPRPHDVTTEISRTSETLLINLKARRKELSAALARQEESGNLHSNSSKDMHSVPNNSMLNKVALSPDVESSDSSIKDTQPSTSQEVPFLSYTVEGETSDKENECQVQHNNKHELFPDDESNKTRLDVIKKQLKNMVERIEDPQLLKSSNDFEPVVSNQHMQTESRLSKVSLHSLSTDTDTLCDAESISTEVFQPKLSQYECMEPEIIVEKPSCTSKSKDLQTMNIPCGLQKVKDSSPSANFKGKSPTGQDNGAVPSKKGHARKGSYTLDEPSPALVRACSKRDTITNVTKAETSPLSKLDNPIPSSENKFACPELGAVECVPKTLDYSELDEEPTRDSPVTHVEADSERMGKEEHLNRYLDSVRLQAEAGGSGQQARNTYQAFQESSNYRPANPSTNHHPALPTNIYPTVAPLTSYPSISYQTMGAKDVHVPTLESLQSENLSSLSSLSIFNDKVNQMSQEDLFNLQASHFDLLRKELVEQQKLQVEQLFRQQQQEQLLLQKEIEDRCRLIGTQQDVLSSVSSQQPSIKTKKSTQREARHSIQSSRSNFVEPSPTDRRSVRASRMSGIEPPANQTSSTVYSYVTSPSLVKHPSDNDNSIISTFSKTTPKQHLFGGSSSPPQPANHVPLNKPVLRSPRQAPPTRTTNRRVTLPDNAYRAAMKPCFDRLSAAVKGYLTRRLLRTEKMQNLIKTVRDTREFAVNFQSETPIKHGRFSMQDRDLLERIIAQLQAALLDIHEVFFEIPVSERMAMIAASRQLEMERRFREMEQSVSRSHPRVSMATLKAMERKKRAQAAEASVFGAGRPRSAPAPETSSPKTARSMDLRALRPLQGQISPIRPGLQDPSGTEVKERPRTAPDRVTVANTHRSTKPRKQSTSGQQGETRRPSKTLLVKAKPSNSGASSTSQGSAGAKQAGKTKSGKTWR